MASVKNPTRKTMAQKVFVEFQGKKVEQKELVDKAKECWKNNGQRVSDLKTLELYYKPDENKCYAVYNLELDSELRIAFDI